MRYASTLGLGMLMTLVACSAGEPPGPPRLIVRGDDMGFSHSGNLALIECFKEGVETSIEVLVPSPWFPEAVKLLAENPGVDVGVHLAITSEWDNIKWQPITPAPSLRDENGYFHPRVWPSKTDPGHSVVEGGWKIADLEAEFRAQIALARKHIPRISHVSCHMGCDSMDKDVKALVKKLADEFGLVASPSDLGVKSVTFEGPHKTSEEKLASFLKMLENLEPGTTSMFVGHPGLDSPELRAIGLTGYENVAEDRQGVTDAWTNPRVRDLIQSRGIQLIGYDRLKK